MAPLPLYFTWEIKFLLFCIKSWSVSPKLTSAIGYLSRCQVTANLTWKAGGKMKRKPGSQRSQMEFTERILWASSSWPFRVILTRKIMGLQKHGYLQSGGRAEERLVTNSELDAALLRLHLASESLQQFWPSHVTSLLLPSVSYCLSSLPVGRMYISWWPVWSWWMYISTGPEA